MDKEKCVGLLLKLKSILNEMDVPFWLTAGTLLGYYRERDFISHDLDMDVGLHIKDYKDEILTKLLANGFKLIQTHGTVERGLEYSFHYNGIKIDLFFFYDDGDKMYHAVWESHHMLKNEYTPFTLENVMFNGINVNVPSDTELFIKEQYGPNWRQLDNTNKDHSNEDVVLGE